MTTTITSIESIPIDKTIELSGSEFNDMFNNVNFVKLTNDIEKHNNFQFADGLNIDIHKFRSGFQCIEGGIYFTNIDEAHKWIYYTVYVDLYSCRRMLMKYMRKVTIPDNAKLCIKKQFCQLWIDMIHGILKKVKR